MLPLGKVKDRGEHQGLRPRVRNVLEDANKRDPYVIPTSRINEVLGTEKTARLSGVESMTEAVEIEQFEERADLTPREDKRRLRADS